MGYGTNLPGVGPERSHKTRICKVGPNVTQDGFGWRDTIDGTGGLDDAVYSIQTDQKAWLAHVLVESNCAWCTATKEGEKVIAENDPPGFGGNAHELDDSIPWDICDKLLDPAFFC